MKGYKKIIHRAILPLLIMLFSLQILLPGCVCYQQSELNKLGTKESVTPKVAVSDGNYRAKILVSWSPVNKAAYYTVMRSEDSGSTFSSIQKVTTGEQGTVVTTAVDPNFTGNTDTGGDSGGTTTITPGEFTSDIDLSEGKYISALQTPSILVNIAGTDAGIAKFPGGTWGHTYTRDEVINILNAAALETLFTATSDGKYIHLSSTKNVVLTNKVNSLSYTPLARFLKTDTPKTGAIIITPTETTTTTTTTTTAESYDINSELFYVLDTNVYNGRKYHYKVAAYTSSGLLILETRTDDGFAVSSSALSAPTGFTVSKGESSITISWNTLSGTDHYCLMKYKVSRIDQVEDYSVVSSSITSDSTSYTEAVENVNPGVYFYKISAYNSKNEEGTHSSPEFGFRAITDDEFMIEYHKEIMLSQQKFTKMHSTGLNAIGTESIEGNISGTGDFSASGGLSGAVANVTYKTYCDSYLSVTGKTTQNIPDIWGKNGTMSGTDYIGAAVADSQTWGIYAGYVEYYLEIKSAQAGGGYYIVHQTVGSSTSATTISWTVIRDWDSAHPEYQP